MSRRATIEKAESLNVDALHREKAFGNRILDFPWVGLCCPWLRGLKASRQSLDLTFRNGHQQSILITVMIEGERSPRLASGGIR
jgi:hypothetical protein